MGESSEDSKMESRKNEEGVTLLPLPEPPPEVEEHKRTSTWRKVIFSFGNFSRYTVLGIQAFYLTPFLLEVANISAFWVGTIQLIKQVYDGLTDPMVGRLSDQINTRWGRRKPLIMLAILPSALFWILQWYSPKLITEQAQAVIYFTLILVIFSTANTFISVPYQAMIPDVTTTYHDRTFVIILQESFGLCAIIIFSFIQAQLIEQFPDPNDPNIVDYQKGYFISSLVTVWAVSIPIAISILFVSEKPHEKEEEDGESEKKHLVVKIWNWYCSFLKSLFEALKFKEFTFLVLNYICSMLAVYMVVNNFVLYVKYVLHIEHQTSFLMLILQISVTVSFFLWGVMSRCIGKKVTFLVGSVIWIGGSVIIFFIDENFIPLFYIVNSFRAIGSGVGYIIPLAILPDLIELDKIKNSQRREGVLYSMMIFLQKAGVGLGIMFSNYWLQFAGFLNPDDQTPQQQEENYQPEDVILSLRALVSFVPIFFIVIANLALISVPS